MTSYDGFNRPSSGSTALPEGTLPEGAVSALAEQMRLLRRGYVEKLGDKLAVIERLRHELMSSDEGAESLLDEAASARMACCNELYRAVHSLAGSGATFGFPDLSEQARRAELLLREWQKDEQAANRSAALNGPPAHAELNILRAVIEEIVRRESASEDERSLVAQIESLGEVALRPLWLLEEVRGDADALDEGLDAFGWEVERIETREALEAARAEGSPSAVLVFVRSNPERARWNGELLTEVLQTLGGRVERGPLLWISENADISARLAAVRAGGDAFFSFPVAADSVVESLEQLVRHDDSEPYRVLIVDDESALARFYTLLLRRAGCEVLEITSSEQITGALHEFAPDLILMDVHLRECSGVDLAVALAQQEEFAATPLVYMSTNRDLEERITAVTRAGDDYLVKPIDAHHLISVVTARAARGRALRQRIERDALTGLLSLTRFLEQLSIEIARVRRAGHYTSLVLLDVDGFASINASYGRAAGDRVLKALALSLTRRLRHTDVIGRYGGEEFALILPGATVEQARVVVEELRHSFADLVHQSGDRSFYATFSAGIVAVPGDEDVSTISTRVDAALQRAKANGKNCISL